MSAAVGGRRRVGCHALGAGGEGCGLAGPPRVGKSGPPGAPPGGLAGALGLCLCDLYHAAWAWSVFV